MATSAQFWDLAEVRLRDAEGLLGIGRWACAYYIAGYAVECALKALIVRNTERIGAIFDDKREASKLLDNFFLHDLEKLLKTTGLEEAFGTACGANPALDNAWEVVLEWKETSRYLQKGQLQAETLVQAINHEQDGVMKWIRDRW
jgi:HEPN domain